MNEAVVVTEWYVVPDAAPAGPHLLVRSERSAPVEPLDPAIAAPQWAWANGADSTPHWQSARAPGTREDNRALVGLLRPARAQAVGRGASAQPVVLAMTPAVLRAMSLAAEVEGRSESALWAEAAREWLARHLGDDPEPPVPGASALVSRREHTTRAQCWSAIDVLLRDLRAPLPCTREEDETDKPAA
jgi:hypothetical protein